MCTFMLHMYFTILVYILFFLVLCFLNACLCLCIYLHTCSFLYEEYTVCIYIYVCGGSDCEESICQYRSCRRWGGSIPRLGKSPGEGNGYPLHCSCLESPMDRGAWWASVHSVTKSWTCRIDTALTHTHTFTSDFAFVSVLF